MSYDEDRLSELSDPKKEPNIRIAALIYDIKRRLDEIVQAKYILFHEDIREAIQSAYDEDIRETRLPTLEEDVKGLESFSRLEQAGLTKANLQMKLAEYLHIRNLFKKKGGIKLPKQLLEIIHIILGSLLEISNAAEPIKEFVELLKLAINESET